MITLLLCDDSSCTPTHTRTHALARPATIPLSLCLSVFLSLSPLYTRKPKRTHTEQAAQAHAWTHKEKRQIAQARWHHPLDRHLNLGGNSCRHVWVCGQTTRGYSFLQEEEATVADPALFGQLGLQMGNKSTENSKSDAILSKVFD